MVIEDRRPVQQVVPFVLSALRRATRGADASAQPNGIENFIQQRRVTRTGHGRRGNRPVCRQLTPPGLSIAWGILNFEAIDT
jgi:hypothetical protein